jgi:hypothetical protein
MGSSTKSTTVEVLHDQPTDRNPAGFRVHRPPVPKRTHRTTVLATAVATEDNG